MKKTIIAIATALSDEDLLARLGLLAGKEREASVELVAHLAALDSRPALYAARGYGSLFSYCTRALRLSEDAACTRIEAARVCRRFPVILDLLALGEMTLTSVRLLGKHLTPENHEAVLKRARGRSRAQIDALVAELAPQPDVPSSVRQWPAPMLPVPAAAPAPSLNETPPTPAPSPTTSVSAALPPPRPVVQITAPERYRVQFTIGAETHEKLRRLQALLRREIPDGDPGVIFDRAVTLLLEKMERTKIGRATRPRPALAIRSRTDKKASRTVPSAVKRVAWQRDGGQCAFVSSSGRRCTERNFLEFHHVKPHAKQGPATVENISLRCRRHNQYEAERVFGPRSWRTERPGDAG